VLDPLRRVAFEHDVRKARERTGLSGSTRAAKNVVLMLNEASDPVNLKW
jgi:hypothetical protein